MRPLIRPGGENDVLRRHRSGRALEHQAAGPWAYRRDLDALPDGRVEARRVALQVADHVVLRHEAVRVVTVVGVSGELDGPVRRDQAEAVPAPAPGLADAAPLEDHVLDAGRG